jgi:predicted MPP superfamily phosphohydrolase
MFSPNPNPNIKTRILIISDTHGHTPSPSTDPEVQYSIDSISSSSSSMPNLTLTNAFRHPLPKADIALHCGDLTTGSGLGEYKATFSMLAALDAPLKIAIAGNHDNALDPDYWTNRYLSWQSEGPLKESRKQYPALARAMIADARSSGVHVITQEGTYDFVLGNGARLKLYASPWTPAFGGWSFQYRGRHDFAIGKDTDIVMTHGPPRDVLDKTHFGKKGAGCKHLLEAVAKVRPRVHCFGHIHEAWGARLERWKVKSDEYREDAEIDEEKSILVDDLETLEGVGTDSLQVRAEKVARRNRWAEKGARRVDLCPSGENAEPDEDGARLARPFEYGEDTLFVNAALVNIAHEPNNLPWLVDLELPKATDDDIRRAGETEAVLTRTENETEAAAAAAMLERMDLSGSRPLRGGIGAVLQHIMNN